MTPEPTLYSFLNNADLAAALRVYVLKCEAAGFERHESFRVAVSGGSLPKVLAQALLGGEDGVDFSRWEIFFADERAVPLEHADSNYKLLKDELLDKIPAESKPQVHHIDVRHLEDVQEMADAYQTTLMGSFAAKDSIKLPIFDLLLLGCGPDGHTCSLFPQHELLRESASWVAPIEDSPKPPARRITLTLPVVTHASHIAFVATGGGKKEVLRQIFDHPDADGQGLSSLPCALVNQQAGSRVSWFTDEAAVEGVAFPKR